MTKPYTFAFNQFCTRRLAIGTKLLVSIALCYMLLLPAIAGARQTESTDDVKASAKNVVDMLVSKNFSGVRGRFNDSLKATLSESRIRQTWQSVVKQAGAFKKQLDPQSQKDERGLDVVEVKCVFANRSAIVRIIFDSEKKINGLWIVPEMTQNTNSTASDEVVSAAKKATDMMANDNFTGLWQWFNPAMKKNLSEAQIRSKWQNMLKSVGSFKNQLDAEFQKDEGYPIADVRCQFENAVMIVRVSIDQEGHIGGLWLLPGR